MARDCMTRVLATRGVRPAIAGTGFLADAYDLFVVDTVANILKQVYGQTTAEKASLSTAALVGSVLGQLFFGVLGDVLGRRVTFLVTGALIVGGALLSAAPTASPVLGLSLYGQLAAVRFLLGLGVGGEYPLSATITSEGSSGSSGSRGRALATVFAAQGAGKLLAALVDYAVIARSAEMLPGTPGAIPLDSAWRLALALGAVPSGLTLAFRWYLAESEYFTELGEHDSAAKAGWQGKARDSARSLWAHRWTLLGTAVSWFLLDVTFYGQGLMNTTVVQQALTGNVDGLTALQKLERGALASLIVVAIALPGYLAAIALIDHVGRRPLQLAGFAAGAVLFLVLGAAYAPLRAVGGGALFVVLFGATYFVANAGPNTTTFVMPAEVFPTRIRSTAHGISAAAGKLGATLGSSGLVVLANAWCTSGSCATVGSPGSDRGVQAVMLVCAGVSLLGLAVSWWLTPESRDIVLADLDGREASRRPTVFSGLVSNRRGPRSSSGSSSSPAVTPTSTGSTAASLPGEAGEDEAGEDEARDAAAWGASSAAVSVTVPRTVSAGDERDSARLLR